MTEPWVSPKLELGRSPVHGTGLFARERIADGERLTRTGDDYVVMTDGELNAYVRTVDSWDSISIGGGRNKVWLGDRDDNPAHFANHSCDPNTVFVGDGLVAARTIRSGEEVTVDYALSSRADWSMRCTCGSAACRGVVGAANRGEAGASAP